MQLQSKRNIRFQQGIKMDGKRWIVMLQVFREEKTKISGATVAPLDTPWLFFSLYVQNTFENEAMERYFFLSRVKITCEFNIRREECCS